MKITISEIPEEGIDIELNESIALESAKMVSPLHAVLNIRTIGSEVLVSGTLDGDVELQCSRCLNAYTVKVQAPVNIVYEPSNTLNKDEHHRLKSDELDIGFYKNDTLDTEDVLVEQLLLNMPMKPLCSTECKGICPECGADLNVTSCNCSVSEVDPRLKVLEQLLKRKE
ncbi:MAG: DUF177 domain-containing protein [Nitrospirae bacterium]|nr:DUF177 domain-containing protein [Nitrospirota bacterium]